MKNFFEEWKEKIFFKQYFEDISRNKLVEAQENFLKGGKWVAYTPLSQEKVLELLSLKQRTNKEFDLNNPIFVESKTANTWSNFFSRRKLTVKEESIELTKSQDLSHKK